MDKQKPLFVRPREAATLIGAGRSKIYEMIQTGEIPSCRIGGMLRVPVAALEKLARDAAAGTTESES